MVRTGRGLLTVESGFGNRKGDMASATSTGSRSAMSGASEAEARRQVAAAALAVWRNSLVNLTGKNRLLSFRKTKTGTLEIAAPGCQDVLNRVNSGNKLTFHPLIKAAVLDPDDSVPDKVVRTSAETEHAAQEWRAEVEERVSGEANTLGVGRDETSMNAVLRQLHRRTSQAFLDTGLWTLYLAVGGLTWNDPQDRSKRFNSPLLLVPVELVRQPKSKLIQLQAVADETVVNPALSLLMRDLEIDFPDLDDDSTADLGSYFTRVSSAIARFPDWSVDEAVYLSYFTFHKEAMYRDLLDNEDEVLASEHVRALATSGLAGQTEEFLFEPVETSRIDEFDPPEHGRLVLDADSSQRAAIRAALDGQSFVLDGPPGTGKSQTIANIIASLVASRKSVLFVSEKAAALEVVKNRLEDVGLGHFVLELHSHKATRKEVSRALGEALSLRPQARGHISESERKRLQTVRQELTRHATEINRPREPLGATLHDEIGRVALLDELTSTPRCAKDLGSLDPEVFGSLMAAAAQLERSWDYLVQGEASAWFGVRSERPIDDVSRTAVEALDNLRLAFAPYRRVAELLGWDQPNASERLATLTAHWRKRDRRIPQDWIVRHDFTTLQIEIDAATDIIQSEQAARAAATDACGDAYTLLADSVVVDGPADSLSRAVAAGLAERDLLSADVAKLREVHRSLETAIDGLVELQEQGEALAKQLGLLAPRNTGDVRDLLEVERVGRSGDRPEPSWITTEVDPRVSAGIETLKSAVETYDASMQAASGYFADGVLTVAPKELQIRFANVHRGFRKLGRAYRSDLRQLAEVSQPGIGPKENIDRLGLAIEWLNAKASLEGDEDQFAELLGVRYRRSETDWDDLVRALRNAEVVVQRARISSLERLATAIGYGEKPDPNLHSLADLLVTSLRSLEGPTAFMSDSSIMSSDVGFQDLMTQLNVMAEALSQLISQLETVDRCLDRPHDVQRGMSAWEAAAEWRRERGRLSDRTEHLAELLGALFEGPDTSCPNITQSRDWAARLRELLLSGQDVEAGALDAEGIAELDGLGDPSVLSSAHQEWRLAVDALVEAFDERRQLQLELDLNDWDEGRELAEFFRTDTAGQSEYFAGIESKLVLEDAGLTPVIDALVLQAAPKEHITGCIEREIRRSWIDHFLDDDPLLRKAGSKTRDALVAEFQELDRALVATTVADIVDEANTVRPTSNAGQSKVLIAQAEKKRNLLPIRELVHATWDVTTRIKPVFMMSPLSVSQFLSPSRRFDVVIFDEASQVLPEDAVNSIYRANQLIIAGDDKQLPPTKFFALSDDLDDASFEDPASAAKDFESVLGLAKGCAAYTSMTLQWHYRSRHEDLITFSNQRFYKGKLVTFPSSQESGDHVGVKFFHVADGVYDRARSTRNLVEARFVAERIEFHFDQRPNMSLGVVTFSQSQAEAIDIAVNELFERRPDLLENLDLSRLDGFFIKNLESVQGDERDVMLFSVGYGPDETGKMTMNFGPLVRDGGWRRLNVAVTRARYRNEIVASFVPGAIRPGVSESLRHFATYLDFAERGSAALALDDVESLGPPESPFEESVVQWLQSRGWDVVTQVGASGYRIDMAVRDPRLPGRFLLGIECDGAQYHSTQAARDRDRLRQEVLEGLGWTLHRIWGPSWYRQRAHEKERLDLLLDELLASEPVGRVGARGPEVPRAAVDVEPVSIDALPEWVKTYRRAHVTKPPRSVDASTESAVPYLRAAIEEIVKVESPVHRDLIDARLRDAWGIARIGPQIRRQIDLATSRARVQVEGDFLYVGDLAQELPTRRHSTSAKRDIQHVHRREIEDTLYRITVEATAIEPSEAMTLTARYLGFLRIGPDVQEALDRALEELVSGGFIDQGEDGWLRRGDA